MKYISPNQKVSTSAFNVCRQQHAIDVFVNNSGSVSIISSDPIEGQNQVTIVIDPLHIDQLIAALQRIKMEF